MTQPHNKSEQFQFGFWRTLGNSPYPTLPVRSFIQTNIPLPNFDGVVPNLISSSFSFRYQNLLASANANTHFCSLHTLFMLVSCGGLKKTVCSIALPGKNTFLTFNEFRVLLFDAITYRVSQRPSLKHVGLSILKFCSSSKPLARNRPLNSFSLSTDCSLLSHLRYIHSWPWLGASQYTLPLFHNCSSFSLASTVFFCLFVLD